MAQQAFQPVPPGFRREVVEAIGRMGSQAKEAVPALREASREADAAVRKAATEALGAVESSGATGGEAR